MIVAVTAVLALAIFAFGLMVSSKRLLACKEQLPHLGRKLQRLTYIFLLVAAIFVLIGFIISSPFIIPGITLLIVAINLYIESQLILHPSNKASFGRQLRKQAIKCTGIAMLLLGILLIMYPISLYRQ